MDAVTYPTESVITFITENFIPLRIKADSEPLATKFNLKWTPTLIVLDWSGKEHFRSVGFLTPEDIPPVLLLGTAMTYFELDLFNNATSCFETILRDYPKSITAPEAVFYLGVCGYKSTHDPKPLKKAYERLLAEYPQSEWTRKALPYRLLP